MVIEFIHFHLGSNKVMRYMSSAVGIVAGVLAVVLAGICHKTFTRICLQHRGSRYSRPSGGLYLSFSKEIPIISLGGASDSIDPNCLRT